MSTEEARIVRCPNCGGDVSEGARSCTYCKAALATVRCHHCYGLSASSAAYCSGCGRELGLEPVGVSGDSTCPGCSARLTSFTGNGGKLFDCAGCGGQFVEHALLTSLLEEREVRGHAVPRRVPRARLALGSVRYLPCPACRALMNRKNFGGDSGVVVDVCPRHGTWFDDGELPRVLAFVESGGLTRARRRELERLQAESRRARAQSQSAPVLDRRATSTEAAGLAVGVADLLTFLGELISL